MKVLFDAIAARWLATMGGATLCNTEADADEVMPYTVYSLVGNVPDMTGNFTDDDEDCLIQFNIFSDTDNNLEILAVFEALKTAFDKFNLVTVDYKTISLVRGNANLIKVEQKWQLNVLYRLVAQKNR